MQAFPVISLLSPSNRSATLADTKPPQSVFSLTGWVRAIRGWELKQANPPYLVNRHRTQVEVEVTQ